MAKLIEMIHDFNENRNSDIYIKILDEIYGVGNYNNCIICDDGIIYYDTKLGIRSKKVTGKNFNSSKIVNNINYNLRVCENCLTEKYNDYSVKNKSRVFNQMNKYSKYAYQINK